MEVVKALSDSMTSNLELMNLVTGVYQKISPDDAQPPFIIFRLDVNNNEEDIFKRSGLLQIDIIDYGESTQKVEQIKSVLIKIFGNGKWPNTDFYGVLRSFYSGESLIVEDDNEVQHLQINFEVSWWDQKLIKEV